MARIKIGDIPRDKKITREEMRQIAGGTDTKDWEEQLNSIGDDAQLANIDLQSALQKQQQTIQTISNVSKVVHDTNMAVVRKIG